ncbi:MAG: lysophospholipid acyltransferase family protein [Myxococcota bacterium]
MSLAARERRALAVQRAVSWLLSPLWMAASLALLRLAGRYRIEDLGSVRAEYRRLRAEAPGPLLVCPNHLTLIDSALVAWALGGPFWWWRHFREFPWNVPEESLFASTSSRGALAWLLKCVPIRRGGDRRRSAQTLARLRHLLERGESVLVFPEGGRSRTGGVDAQARTYGVGRILGAVSGCRVLCVHLRGVGQDSFSDLPRRGERFQVRLALFDPRSEARGLRRSLELTRQVLGRLASLEAACQPPPARAPARIWEAPARAGQ